MATPSIKSFGMKKAIDGLTEQWYGRKRTTSIVDNVCVVCGGPASQFKDALSRKEYTISGMCQSCQDDTFGG